MILQYQRTKPSQSSSPRATDYVCKGPESKCVSFACHVVPATIQLCHESTARGRLCARETMATGMGRASGKCCCRSPNLLPPSALFLWIWKEIIFLWIRRRIAWSGLPGTDLQVWTAFRNRQMLEAWQSIIPRSTVSPTPRTSSFTPVRGLGVGPRDQTTDEPFPP